MVDLYPVERDQKSNRCCRALCSVNGGQVSVFEYVCERVSVQAEGFHANYANLPFPSSLSAVCHVPVARLPR